MYPLSLPAHEHLKQQVLYCFVAVASLALLHYEASSRLPENSLLQTGGNHFGFKGAKERGVGFCIAIRHERDTLKEQVRRAALIIKGKVTAANIEDKALPQTISEHDPLYRKAVIQINEVLKGRINKKKLSVYYASSDDVLWYPSPKLTPGQEGIFLLQTGQAARVFDTGVFTVLHKLDVLPVKQLKQIRQLLK